MTENNREKRPPNITEERFKKAIEEYDGADKGIEKIEDAIGDEIRAIKESDLSAEKKLRKMYNLLPGEEDTSKHTRQLNPENDFVIESEGKEYKYIFLYQQDDYGNLTISLAPEFNLSEDKRIAEKQKERYREANRLLKKALKNN